MPDDRRGDTWVGSDGNTPDPFYRRGPEMIDEPKAATAAQMASRNLKTVKNKRRATPISSLGVPQSMSFGAGAGAGVGAGGLFGGSVQAGVNTFTFAPMGLQVPSLPSPSFGPQGFTSSNSGAGATSAEEQRQRAVQEELDRRNNPFQASGRSTFVEQSSSGGQQGGSSSSAPAQPNISGGFTFNLPSIPAQPENTSDSRNIPRPAMPGIDQPNKNFFGNASTRSSFDVQFGSQITAPERNFTVYENFPVSDPYIPNPSNHEHLIPYDSGEDDLELVPQSSANDRVSALEISDNSSRSTESTPPPANKFGTFSNSLHNTYAPAWQPNFSHSASSNEDMMGVEDSRSRTDHSIAQANTSRFSGFATSDQVMSEDSAAAEKSSTNFFGTVSPNPLFGPSPPKTNLFASPYAQPPYSAPSQQPTMTSSAVYDPTTSMSGNSRANTLFGTAPGEDAQPANIFTRLNPPAPSSNNLFKSQPVQKPEVPVSLLSNKNPLTNDGDSSTFPLPTTQANSNITSPFGISQPAPLAAEANTNTQSSPMKPDGALSSVHQPPPGGMFPNIPVSTTALAFSNSDIPKGVNTTVALVSDSSNTLLNGDDNPEVDRDSVYSEMAVATALSDENLSLKVPPGASDSEKNEFYTAYRLRSLNVAIQRHMGILPFADLSGLIEYYREKKGEIIDRMPTVGSKRKCAENGAQNQDSSKRTRIIPPPPKSTDLQPHHAAKRKSSDDGVENEDEENLHPIKRSRQQLASASSILGPAQPRTQNIQRVEKTGGQAAQPQHSTNEPTVDALHKVVQVEQADKDVLQLAPATTNSDAQGRTQSVLPPLSSTSKITLATEPSTNGKRKADVQLTKEDEEREERESRKAKARGVNSDTNGSSTSTIFKGIVDTPGKPTGKKFAPMRGTPSFKHDVLPRTNPFASLLMPEPSAKIASSPTATPVNLLAMKATPNVDNNVSSAQKTGSSMGLFATPSTMNAPNMFAAKPATNMSSFNSPPTMNAPSIFAAKPATNTSSVATPSTMNAPNMFATKPATNMSLFVPKAAPNSGTTTAPLPGTNLFEPKPVSNETTTTMLTATSGSTESMINSPKPQAGPPKFGPPKFGNPTGSLNFMAQFAAKAKDTEKSLMAKAMEEDLDSDDDEATVEQWKADYNAKRKAERDEYERIAKGSTSGGKEKTAGSANFPSLKFAPAASTTGENNQSATTPSTMFARSTQSPEKNGFNSGTSTPGAIGSGTGSILDGHVPGRPVNFGGDNMFGHLSTPEPTSDAQDEDTSSESDKEEDSENKDPNYVPGADSGSPGTPVEETASGIASAKKATQLPWDRNHDSALIHGDSASGTSTPKRSLMDLINMNNKKDSDGNYIKSQSPEDKETSKPTPSTKSHFAALKGWQPTAESSGNGINTQPTSIFNNPFASLNKTPAAATDNTWKPETPITFGSRASMPDNGGNPEVSITEASPSKISTPSLFSGLSTAKPPVFSNLFGNADQKPPTPVHGPASTGLVPGSSSGSSLFSFAETSKVPALVVPPPTGFLFGSSSASPYLSAGVSGATSRATSPGNTTDGASDYEDPDVEKHDQLDLTSGGPGEEDEDEVHKVRAKALQFIPGEGGAAGTWTSRGVGPLRVLKHKVTGATRIVLRQDPSGKVIINKALLQNAEYKLNDKTVRFPAAADGGGLETWLLQVKEQEWAKNLAEVLEANK